MGKYMSRGGLTGPVTGDSMEEVDFGIDIA